MPQWYGGAAAWRRQTAYKMAAARATQETHHEGVIHFTFRLTYIYIIKFLYLITLLLLLFVKYYWYLLTYGIFILWRCDYVFKSAKACTGSALSRDYARSYNENPAIFEWGRRQCPYHLNMIMHKNDVNRLRENVLSYLLCNILSLRALCMSDTTLFTLKPCTRSSEFLC